MKKLVFMFVAVAAISFASCGGNKTQQAEAVDSDSIATVAPADSVAAPADSAATDSVKTDSVK